jgi:hypothetical protein
MGDLPEGIFYFIKQFQIFEIGKEIAIERECRSQESA